MISEFCTLIAKKKCRLNKLGLLLLFTLSANLQAQSLNQQRREFAIVNVGINGIVGGVGALINKRKGEKPIHVFIKGLGQGCLGGTFQVVGKELTNQIRIKQNIGYAWPARLTNAIGNSIAQNAANNINFWERWHFNLGLFRMDYDVKEKHLQLRVFPSSVYGTIAAGRQAKWNLKKTLQTGIMIYEKDGLVKGLGGVSVGFAFVSSIALDKNLAGMDYFGLVAHEVVHILQYENMIWINPMLTRLDRKWKKSIPLYQSLSKYMYADLNGLTILGLYLTQINLPRSLFAQGSLA